MARPADPIAAIATAPGRGAVGMVRVSGPAEAVQAVVRALCGRPLAPRHATYLPFTGADGHPIDQGLALHFPAPHSYTGEDVLELQGHGGPVVLRLVLARCLEAGAAHGLRLARPGEFTERAFRNGKLDLAQAEGVADLIDASTESAARSASRSLAGAFSQAVQGLRDALVALRLLVEATLDFPEEDIDFIRQADAAGRLRALQAQLAQVLAKTRQGALLREGAQVVIAGQPNAGKSSLLNALAQAELAIVTPVAGTTRDVLSQHIQIEGVPLAIVDTAGLRETQDAVERIGIARAWDRIAQADAVLFLHDAGAWDAPESRAAQAALMRSVAEKAAEGTPVIEVLSKADLWPEGQALPAGLLPLSCHGGQGLEALRQRLLAAVGWQALPEGVWMGRERHIAALNACGARLAAAAALLEQPQPPLELLAEELRLAQNALNEITGAFGSDDLLGLIFSRFCIGK